MKLTLGICWALGMTNLEINGKDYSIITKVIGLVGLFIYGMKM